MSPVTRTNSSRVESIPYRVLMMALFAHLQHTDSILPKPLGPLSTVASASTITAANKDETGNRPEAIRGSFSHEIYPEGEK